jgi:hypothetical protein
MLYFVDRDQSDSEFETSFSAARGSQQSLNNNGALIPSLGFEPHLIIPSFLPLPHHIAL